MEKKIELPVMLPTGHRLDYKIGETVFIVHDPEQLPRMVTGITLEPECMVSYGLSCGESNVMCYSIEINSVRSYD